jgi:hypothetical protein
MLSDVKKLSLIPWLLPVWCWGKHSPEVPTNGEGVSQKRQLYAVEQ